MSHKLQNYLRTYRKRSGLSQDEVAFLLGCQTGAKVSRYEPFARKPSLETLFAYEVRRTCWPLADKGSDDRAFQARKSEIENEKAVGRGGGSSERGMQGIERFAGCIPKNSGGAD